MFDPQSHSMHFMNIVSEKNHCAHRTDGIHCLHKSTKDLRQFVHLLHLLIQLILYSHLMQLSLERFLFFFLIIASFTL